MDVNHHFSHGLQFRGVYTYAKALDDGDSLNTSVATNSPAFAANPLDPCSDYGRASFDIRHSAVINATYDLPFGAGKAFMAASWVNRLVGRLAAQRHRDAAIRPAFHTATVLQPVQRW